MQENHIFKLWYQCKKCLYASNENLNCKTYLKSPNWCWITCFLFAWLLHCFVLTLGWKSEHKGKNLLATIQEPNLRGYNFKIKPLSSRIFPSFATKWILYALFHILWWGSYIWKLWVVGSWISNSFFSTSPSNNTLI